MIDRRTLLGGALPVALTLAGCAPRAARTRPPGDLFFIGSNGTTLHAARLDARAGELRMIGPVATLSKPTWALLHPRLPMLYVADQGAAGQVVAFRIDLASGGLTRAGAAPAGGGTTHLAIDPRGRALLAANYAEGSVASIAIGPDGFPGGRISTIAASGSGPHRRQASPHAHGVMLDPSGRFALVADLGTDRLFVYRFDPRTGALADDDVARHLILPSGSGPRHFAFHPNGRIIYLLGELTADIFAIRWDARAGRATLFQTLSANAPGFTGASTVSEVVISRDGRFAYVANRGDSTIVVHAIDPRDFTLRPIQRIASGGNYPWDFRIHAGGRWMIVANERSDLLTLLAIDPRNGMLTATGKSLAVPKPVNITFAGVD
jgi:6-phosphogluconolactonase